MQFVRPLREPIRRGEITCSVRIGKQRGCLFIDISNGNEPPASDGSRGPGSHD